MGARSRAIRRLPVGAIALATLVWAGPVAAEESPSPPRPSTAASSVASPRDRPSSERGIVQSVSASGLVLKALDGSTVTVAVDARTRVLLDGRATSIGAVRPGFVVVVTLRGASDQPALQVEAFTTTPSSPSRPLMGIVRSVSASELVLTPLRGGRVSVKLASVARVLIDGKPGLIGAVRVGFVAVFDPGASSASGKGKGKAEGQGERGELFAFSPPRQAGGRLYHGTITAVGERAIRLQAQGVGSVMIAITAKAALFADGKSGSLGDLQAGELAVVRTRPRLRIWVFSVR
jgi:hypothetical protein